MTTHQHPILTREKIRQEIEGLNEEELRDKLESYMMVVGYVQVFLHLFINTSHEFPNINSEMVRNSIHDLMLDITKEIEMRL